MRAHPISFDFILCFQSFQSFSSFRTFLFIHPSLTNPRTNSINLPSIQRSCLLITLHYIDTICTRTPTFTVSSLTCHRFLITSVAVSSKALCDAFCTNNLYARVGGIPVGELNLLEREFLRMIDWRLTVRLSVLFFS